MQRDDDLPASHANRAVREGMPADVLLSKAGKAARTPWDEWIRKTRAKDAIG
jgi:hypothetical protein